MRKALLADDDFLVRSYLKMLSSWEKAGFEITADVRDGVGPGKDRSGCY